MLNSQGHGGLSTVSLFASQNSCLAAHVHVICKRNFGGHYQRHLDNVTVGQSEVRPQHRATRTEVLGASGSTSLLAGQPQKNGDLVGKPLTRTALNPVLLGARHQANTLTQEHPSGK
ncbi:MAG TPA: hypothetical protein VJO35_19305 [Terriglobales bacterium]|nr:hypothetical protein [Terriglobales bacterium]